MTEKDQKEIMKEAIKEWMDDQYSKFGRFILGKLLWAGLASFLIWHITARGYKFP